MGKPETLKDLIKMIETEQARKSLSDSYLREHGHLTRDDIGVGEYQYGVVMVPEDWVLPYLKRLYELYVQR